MQISNIARSKESLSAAATGLLSIALLKESAEGGLQGAFLDLFILVRRLIRE